MFSEVVPEVAAFLEDASALWILALKVELDSLGFGISHSDGLVPLFGHPFEGLVLGSS